VPEHDGFEEGSAVPRSFWSGTISFGLVSIPVDLYTATRAARVSLRLLGPEGTPLQRRYFCPRDGAELDRDELVRGYPLETGEYVRVSDEELAALAPEKTRDIDLRRFVPIAEIDPLYFERAYLLTPGGESTKAYRLLAEVMERSGRAGVATFVMRGKEYLVAIFAEEGILRAETLRFQDEVRQAADIGLPEAARVPRAAVERWAAAIAATAAEELDLGELEDELAQRILTLAEAKRKRRQDVVRFAEADEPEGGEVVDLMEVLRRRLRGSADEEAPRRRPPKAARPRGRRQRHLSSLGELSKDELYQRARELDLPGRASMNKGELVEALRRRR
jgi:DNA end-binding protein Ku